MVAVPIGRPFLEVAHEPAFGDVRQDYLFRNVGKAESIQGRVERAEDVVEGQLTLDADLDLAPILLELPRVEPAEGWKAEIDAGVADEVLRVGRLRVVGEVG